MKRRTQTTSADALYAFFLILVVGITILTPLCWIFDWLLHQAIKLHYLLK